MERSFGAESTASEVVAGIDLRGRTALVTGASGGIGAETARALAQAGAAVTLTARDVAKGRAVAEAIRASTGNDAIEVRALELHVPASVRRFAEGWRADHPALHILVNNAGVMACPLARTSEGWELQLATNHFGHFLLTALLAPALRAGHRFSPVVFEDLHFERRPYDKWAAYGQSKTANVLFAVELDRRLSRAGVRGFALHPGAIVTELGRHLSRDDLAELRARSPGGRGLVWKQVPAGAATSVWAATAPELEGRGGLYLEDCHVASPRRSDEDEEGYEAWAVDEQAAGRLWQVSEAALEQPFRPAP
jgi:NAD(P)-dependent dehydrogenase (short-subunit alcohol dehydrogenase family)